MDGLSSKARLTDGFRKIPWLPVLATALMAYRCYIPGRSDWNLVGIFLWFIALCLFVHRLWVIRDQLTAPLLVSRSQFLTLLTLAVASCVALTDMPVRWAFNLSQRDLDRFVNEHRTQTSILYARTRLQKASPPLFDQIGIYKISDYAMDYKGGVFLVTTDGERFDGSHAKYGFAYQPLLEDRPFGGITSKALKLNDSWLVFDSVTIDWNSD